jgi:hypothetical protein
MYIDRLFTMDVRLTSSEQVIIRNWMLNSKDLGVQNKLLSENMGLYILLFF